MAKLFSEFPGISKSEWLSKIEKDLKGKPYSDLKWHLSDTLSIDPLFTPEDFESFAAPIPKMSTDWLIGETIDVKDFEQANKDLFEALNGGVNAPEILFNDIPSKVEWSMLFNGVALEMIHLYMDGGKGLNWNDLITSFIQFVTETGINIKTLKGAFKIPLDVQLNYLEQNAPQFENWQTQLSGFSFFHIDGRDFHENANSTEKELAFFAEETSKLISKAANAHLDHLQYSVTIGTSYFVEIAKIRALKLIFGNLLKAYDLPVILPFIDCTFARYAMKEESEMNMIRNTTQAMSAVLGGADRITVAPSNLKTEIPNSFTKRIARNVQHLLQLESNLNKVYDPAAGSYYIEKLTTLFTEKTWQKLA